MNTNALRQKILDLAIHGKLVKQDPADESATILLEKIRAEKEKKIASGELKRGKNDSYIFLGDDNRHYEKFADGRIKNIEDEIPFAVPEGWAWCRLGELSKLISKGTTPRGGKNAYTVIGVNYLRIENINDYGTIDLKNISHITEEEHFGYLKRSILQENDFIVSIAGTLGKTAIVRKQDLPLNTNQAVAFVRLEHFDILNLQFLRIIIESSTIKELLLKQTKVTSIPNLTLEIISSCFIPLPPLAEQKRIVTAIEAILAQIDLLEQNKADLQTAVKQAKSKILDLAIRGKLVPQDPVDEPASVMLEKLRAEKEVKIAAGEIKRGKNESYIYKNSTDNCYYEKFGDGIEKVVEMLSAIPESWTWCHFGDVADVINGKNQSQVEDDTGEYPIYGSGGIMGYANDYICPENCTIIGRKGSINNPIFVEEKLWNVDTAFGLAPSSIVLPRYLFYFCKSFDFTSLDSSTTLPSLTKTHIQRILFPLPPLAAQQRILDKVDDLFIQLDKITLSIV